MAVSSAFRTSLSTAITFGSPFTVDLAGFGQRSALKDAKANRWRSAAVRWLSKAIYLLPTFGTNREDFRRKARGYYSAGSFEEGGAFSTEPPELAPAAAAAAAGCSTGCVPFLAPSSTR